MPFNTPPASGNGDPSCSAKSSTSSLAVHDRHTVRSKNSNTTFSDEDVSDDTVSSSDGPVKSPVLSDYAKALLQASKLKTRLAAAVGIGSNSHTPSSTAAANNAAGISSSSASSSPSSSTLQASSSATPAPSAFSSTSSLRLGNAFSGSIVIPHHKLQLVAPRAGASPINGSRQQHEIQRHLNRVKLEQKSTSEDDLRSLANAPSQGNGARLRHYSSTGSNNSLDHDKAIAANRDGPLNVSRSTGSLRTNVPIFDSSDQPVKSSHDEKPATTVANNGSPNVSPQQQPVVADPSPKPVENVLATPAFTRSNPRNQLSTVRVKRFGRGLGPPKRTVRRDSEEGLTDADNSEELKEPVTPTQQPVPELEPEPAVGTPEPEFSHPPSAEPSSPPSTDPVSDPVSDPVPDPVPEVPDKLDATESDAARKRRSELYDAAERAHAFPEEDKNTPKSEVEIEREKTLEHQHQELRHYLQLQEQLIQQQQQQQMQLQSQQLQQQHQQDPVAVQLQQQQYMMMQQQQQQGQPVQPSASQPQPPSRKQKNMIYVNGQSYQRLELIGRGGSSKVYKAQSGNGKIYAIKRVSCDDDIDLTVLKGFKGEIDLLQRLKSEDRVVKLIDFEMRANSIYVIMECGEIDLAHVLNARLSHPLDISFVRYYAVEMLHCVSAVHRHDIVHSDLKPANFLLVKGMLKIIDFGIANVVPDYTSNVHRDTQIGTPNYMAPEALLDANHVYAKPADPKNNDSNDTKNDKKSNGNNRNSIISLNNSNIHAPIPPPSKPAPTKFKVGRPSDVWSCGCIIYQMIYGRPPYGGYQGTQRMLAIMNPKVQIAYPKQGLGQVRVPKEAIEVIKGCLERDPTQRMTIDTAINGSFLNPQAVDRKFIQDLLAHAVKYGAERGLAMKDNELDLLTDNVWKKIQASNL